MRGNKLKKMVLGLLITLAGIYIVVLVGAYFLQEKFLFFPQKLPTSYKYHLGANDKEVFIKAADGETINGILFTRPGNKDVILYFHGNAGALDSWQDVWSELDSTACNLLIIDYRGYGKSTGSFSEDGFYKDAEACYNYLLSNGYKADNIIPFGRSLGTGVAVNLAVERKVKALILESPYCSIKELAGEKFPYLFPSLYLRYTFNSLAKAPSLTLPILLIHGDKDELIPCNNSERLFQAIRSPKKLVIIKGGAHNGLSAFPEHNSAIRQFLSTL